MTEKFLNIHSNNIKCASCVANIENSLKIVNGILDCSVNLVNKKISVKYNSEIISPCEIADILDSIGYKPIYNELKLIIKDLHCAACVANVEKILNSKKEIIKININLATKHAKIEYFESLISPEEIKALIKDSGYTPVDIEPESSKQLTNIDENEYLIQKNKFLFSLIYTLPILLLSMIPVRFPCHDFLLLILSIPVLFWAGKDFYIGAYKAFIHRTANMNTLVAIGTGVAFLYSVIITIKPDIFNIAGQVYYEVSTVIITLILMGKMLEAKAKGKTSLAIKKLIGLQPKTASVYRNNKEEQVSIKEINVDDIILIRPGEKLPVDGIIIEGFSTVDQSTITGESFPVEKNISDNVIGGTINKTGSFKYRATKIGNDTMLYQIIKLIEDAQTSKAPIQKIADTVSSYFVPVVMIIAIITFILWYDIAPDSIHLSFAITTFVAVLIIACPCALGLATPTAIMVGTGLGANKGILIKNAESLETACKVDTIVFDKTGTITVGKPEVIDICTDMDEKELLCYTASAEQVSEHPTALAITNAAKSRNIELFKCENFNAETGKGICATINNKSVIVGNQKFLRSRSIDLNKFISQVNTSIDAGKSVIYTSIDGQLAGIISIADVVKPEAKAVITSLKEMGFEVAMITGDHKATANNICKQVGIERVISEVLPQDKAKVVKEIQSEGQIVAMVGDGTNDAPALAQAQVGFAIGTGTDIAIESADITLMNGDLNNLIKAIKLSQKTMQAIKQNMFFAFIYNILGIPIAAGILYPFFGILLSPMISALAMSLSSVSVVTNSLRLGKAKI